MSELTRGGRYVGWFVGVGIPSYLPTLIGWTD